MKRSKSTPTGTEQKTLSVEEYRARRDAEKLEADVQAEVLKYLTLCGVLTFVVPNRGLYDKYSGRYNRKESGHIEGIPDMILILPRGRVAFLELKRPNGGVVSPAQQHMLQLLGELGHVAAIVHSREEVETLLKTRGLL